MRKEIIEVRKELHQHPERSGEEFETAQRIKDFIQRHNPTKVIENLGGTGLAAVYEFDKKGPVIAIRCELDALPIQEENQFEHRSRTLGVSHKCGHDGHMAIVTGLIFWIKEGLFRAGKIVLLFQPAEETGKGARQVVEDKKFKALAVDYIFALHNIPNEALHKILIIKKGFSAEVISFKIMLVGKESHAAEPENGINPASTISEIIASLSKLDHNQPQDDNFAVLTPIHINMGQIAYGISPARGELHYTIRTWNPAEMDKLKSNIESVVKNICHANRLQVKLDWLEHFPASKNFEECNEVIFSAAQEHNFTIKEPPFPFRFGEDFGWFSKVCKTAMFGLGAGINTPALHHADYDFPDEIIETGIAMFKSILTNILSRPRTSKT